MKLSPKQICAVAVVAVAGAISGAAIGTTPVIERETSATMPQANFDAARAASAIAAKPAPNHYPIVTPQGRFEVSELSSRGLYRNARYEDSFYNAPMYDEAVELAAETRDFYVAEDVHVVKPISRQPAVAAVAPTIDESTRAQEPLFAQATPFPQPEIVQGPARMVDVAATLAARN
ncbi:hypothetical protein [Qipengyuania marisflavi]|uniref:SPOR domain-containing protein n=1 Tax=Qipengyuania marisflavi TaxID=2486356 RepID=A0A5S3PT03_9SPHN|nr:hypothetical protein [Qipengyuania marisflavi]TMM46723.1 hypothetical protein FEV51_10850 [Qipengyuania marisflavi]